MIMRASTRETWLLCVHLRPILEALLAHGAAISFVSTSWSRVELAVALNSGPARADIAALLAPPAGVITWENNDSHYALEYGVVCTACAHSLSWPQARVL
jgi:hypothetical protein